MARKRAMSQREVDALKKPGMTCVSSNLYLQIRDGGNAKAMVSSTPSVKPSVVAASPTGSAG